MNKKNAKNLAWLDLEMTGLDPENHVILQAALIITDSSLNEKERLCIDIWQPEDKLKTMSPFVRDMHEKTGLLEKIKSSRIDTMMAERKLLKLVYEYCEYQAYLCGNTISADRKFLDKYMPALSGYFHYRMLDVSSLKILSELWFPNKVYQKPVEGAHNALIDIKNSILELEYYQKQIIKV